LIAVTGCGDKLGKLAPVEGKVTVNGTPLTSGMVRLWPEQVKPGAAMESIGGIGSDGSYQIKTNGKPGAPLGKYKVSISYSGAGGDTGAEADPAKMAAGPPGPQKEQPKPFNPRFETPDGSGLQFDVTAAPSPGQYDLKLTR